MKFLIPSIIAFGIAVPTAASAQVYGYGGYQYGPICTQTQNIYTPGRVTPYGNYVPGFVTTESYNYPCNGNTVIVNSPPVVQAVPPGYYSNPGYYQNQRVCNPTAGAAMGAGLGEALGGGNGWKYNSNWSGNYSRNGYSGSYNNSYRNYKSNGWSLFGAGLGALMFSC
jgi:hypothetical protein